MKTNIILALTVLVCLSSSFFFSSCQNDDDEATLQQHYVCKSYYHSSNIYAIYDYDDNQDEYAKQTAACVLNYLKSRLQGLTENVEVASDFGSIVITASADNESELVAILTEMQQDSHDELSALIEESLPFVQSVNFCISRLSDSSNVVFSFGYNRLSTSNS